MLKELMNKSNYSKWLLVLGVAVFILIATIVLVHIIGLSSNASDQLDNFAIDNLSAEDIIYKEVSTTLALSREYESGTKTGVSGASKYEDSDESRFACKKITGITRVSATKVADCTLTLNISSKLLSGKAKIVVICDDQILEYIEFDQNKTLTYDVKGECVYSIKILAEEAELEIFVDRIIN